MKTYAAVQHAAAFSFGCRISQRQRKESSKHMGNTHAASCFSTMQCSIFSLADAQQIS
jgi:hypothetical protein